MQIILLKLTLSKQNIDTLKIFTSSFQDRYGTKQNKLYSCYLGRERVLAQKSFEGIWDLYAP